METIVAKVLTADLPVRYTEYDNLLAGVIELGVQTADFAKVASDFIIIEE
jgi:hypothetical protein